MVSDDDDTFRAVLAFIDGFDSTSQPDRARREGACFRHKCLQEAAPAQQNTALQGSLSVSVGVRELSGAFGSGCMKLLDESALGTTVADQGIALVCGGSLESRCGDSMTLVAPSLEARALNAASNEALERSSKRVKTASSNGDNRTRTSSGYEPVRKRGLNKAHNEHKQELLFLRSKATELEAALRALQLKPKSDAGGSCSICADGASRCQCHRERRHLRDRENLVCVAKRLHPANEPTSRVWQVIADRQRALREEAEREHIRLKLALAGHVRVAKLLGSFFHKSSNRALQVMLSGHNEAVLLFVLTTLSLVSHQEIAKCLDGMYCRPASGHFAQATGFTPDPSDAAAFDALLNSARRCYEEIDAVFAANGLARIETTYMDARMRRDRVNTENGNFGDLHLEITATKLLPFDFEAASEVA